MHRHMRLLRESLINFFFFFLLKDIGFVPALARRKWSKVLSSWVSTCATDPAISLGVFPSKRDFACLSLSEKERERVHPADKRENQRRGIIDLCANG